MLRQTNISESEESTLDKSGISDNAITIYSRIVFGGVCLAIDIFGIGTNIINITCFIKQGFHESSNISFCALSVSDLCSLIALSWANTAFTPAVLAADLALYPSEVVFLVAVITHLTFSQITSWITALITLERCLCVIAPIKVRNIFTSRRVGIIIVCIYIVLVLNTSPVYAVNKLEWKFSPQRNKTIYGLVFTEDREYVQKIMFIVNNFSSPFTAFSIIVIFTVILVIKLQKATNWRQKSTAAMQKDIIFNRNQKVTKMVVMVSFFFIVCFIPISIVSLVTALEPRLSYGGGYIKIEIIIGGVSFIIGSINSSMNVFIYYHMSSRYRGTFREIFYRKSKL